MEWEFGRPGNLLFLISIVEHMNLPAGERQLQAKIVYEVVRQITTEEKAAILLQRYGISKILTAIKNLNENAYHDELKHLVEELAIKLIKTGRNILPIQALYAIAQSSGIVKEVHIALQQTAWEALVEISANYDQEESKTSSLSSNREQEFEVFVPKFVAYVQMATQKNQKDRI